MNISAYILEYLKQFGSVTVPGFGVFYLENSKAIINSDNGSILPPSSQIAFTPDYGVKSDELAAFISSQKQSSIESSKNELLIQTDFWKKKLQADQMLEIQNLGSIFIEDGKTHFKGNRLESDHPDFYGLEEIRISDMNVDHSHTDNMANEYQFNTSLLWIFLFIVPVLGILYLTYTQPELLFGKKSFDEASAQVRTQEKVKEVVRVKYDSLQQKRSDSLKKDSLADPAAKNAGIQTNKNNIKATWQK
ncbi:hypothetical protein HNP38_003355 [Chryseobacterium defluvii]|uniref:CCDC81-like prokaryotic HU domain-containing protein n=1 Tax=Chryseobacterium defluvii TaxID=160396 RepID=A0A840KH49_9FLAO|nr:hypothetical protein [Chryseobacterium defluvii]MBB4808015.1 hypothetical protein [Chryseobacterium defluvii]